MPPRRELVFWGWLLTFEPDGSQMEFRKRSLRTDGRTVLEIGTTKPREYEFSGVAMPSFEDAHSHLADRRLKVPVGSAIERVVRPPDGLKHAYLKDAPKDEVVWSLRAGLTDLVRSGATRTHEFREGGIAGVQMFREALRELEAKWREHMGPIVLGRPGSVVARPADEKEFFEKLRRLLQKCDGLGLSAISDGNSAWNVEVARASRRAGKLVEVHCSESQHDPIEPVIAAGASQVVHMVHGTDDDFRAMAEKGIPVAVCTRSNEFFGLTAPVARMVECGVDIRIGTDNAFLGAPDMFAEARAFARVHKQSARLSATQILASMLRRQGINEGPPIAPREGDRPDLIILDIQTEKPERALIAKGQPENVVAVVGAQGGKP